MRRCLYEGPINVLLKEQWYSFYCTYTSLEKFTFPPKMEVSTKHIFGRTNTCVLICIVLILIAEETQSLQIPKAGIDLAFLCMKILSGICILNKEVSFTLNICSGKEFCSTSANLEFPKYSLATCTSHT